MMNHGRISRGFLHKVRGGWLLTQNQRQVLMSTRPNLTNAIYGGRDPRDTPAYFLADAAHYLRLPTATVRSWVLGRRYPTESGTSFFRPLIDIPDPDGQLLSFNNLVELHVLSAIRRVHRVELKAVRRTIKYLNKHLHSPRPFLTADLLTDGESLFIERYGQLVNTSADGQIEMGQLLEKYLRRIDRDSHGAPIRLFPFTRNRIEASPRLVAIDPKIRFGKPCLTGTGIPTRIIAERYEAGDSIAFLVKDYGRPTEEIEEAIRYESRAAS
jgi:uncharacterized protein (DUF433 family)